MKSQDKLKAWMDENGYSYGTLAHELGFSETYVFKLMVGTKPLGSGFKLKFLLRFGNEEASKLFDTTPQMAQPTP